MGYLEFVGIVFPPVGIYNDILKIMKILKGKPNTVGFVIDVEHAKFEAKKDKIIVYKVDWDNYSPIGIYGKKIYNKYYGSRTLPSYLYRAEIILQIINKELDKLDEQEAQYYITKTYETVGNTLSGKMNETEADKHLFTDVYTPIMYRLKIEKKEDREKFMSDIVNPVFSPFKNLVRDTLLLIGGTLLVVALAIRISDIAISIPNLPLSIGGKKK